MITIVFDLGPGDGGKGGIVHKLATHRRAHTVIKVGGAQGSHGVNNGKHQFAFSQWGCGTLEGILTHLSRNMIVSPEGLLNEAQALNELGINNPFDLITCDESAICATPYHGVISRLKELARGNSPCGTIGTGVGETYRDSLSNPELNIYAKELKCNLRGRLLEIRNNCRYKVRNILDRAQFLSDDMEIVSHHMELLEDDGFLNHITDRFLETGNRLRVVDESYLKRNVFTNDHEIIVESSHGILTDNLYGFRPHVSAIRTLPTFTKQMLYDYDYVGHINTVGVHRAYSIRHGAGPLPTFDQRMTNDLSTDSHKDENRYQGAVRVGPLDLVLMRYAIDVCGGVDSVILTWFDQVATSGCWEICERYDNIDLKFFDSPSRIKAYGDGDDYRDGLCNSLLNVKPIISVVAVPNSAKEQFVVCNQILHDKLGVGISMLSFGKTQRDKLAKEDV